MKRRVRSYRANDEDYVFALLHCKKFKLTLTKEIEYIVKGFADEWREYKKLKRKK